MNLQNKTNFSNSINPQLFEDLSDDITNDIPYGWEYILDEIFPEKKMEIIHDQSTDWFGLSDLMI